MDDYYKNDPKTEPSYNQEKTQDPSQEPNQEPPQGFTDPEAESNVTLALTSMILGICSIVVCPITSLPAVICGHLALGKIKRGEAGGKGMAIAGLITGYLCILFVLLLICLFVILAGIPAIRESHSAAEKAKCMNNLKQIGVALHNYSFDYDTFPPDNGVKGLNILIKKGYISEPKLFVCPECDTTPAEPGQPLTEDTCDYKYFGGNSFNSSPADTILMSDKHEHPDGSENSLYINGHVKDENENLHHFDF